MPIRLIAMFVFALGVAVVPHAQNAAPRATPAGGNWPQWRGPNRDGISSDTGLLKTWPRGGPRRLFVTTGLGAGFSSVAVTGGRIYTMGDLPAGQHVFALDEATGRQLWATRVGVVHRDEFPGPRATPTVDGELLYAMSTSGDLVCLEAATGRERWRKSLPRDFGAPTPGWMFAESPLVDGNHVIIAPGGRTAALVALNKTTGADVWRTPLPSFPGRRGVDGPDYSSVVISNGGGVKQYIRMLGRGIMSVRAADGTLLWTYDRVNNVTANIPTPIVRGNLVFASTGYDSGGSALLELVPGERGNIQARERYYLEPRAFQNHHGGMVLIGDHVYAGKGHNNGLPVCIELATGHVAWGGNFRNAGSGSAAVTAADGHLYFRYQNGMMILIEATPREYVEKGSFEIPNVDLPSWSHPVVTAGRLYLREQDALNVYDVRQ